MIQRIQTLYLLAIVLLSGYVFFAPLADLVNSADNLLYLLDFKGISLLKPTGNLLESTVWGLNTVSLIVPVLAIISIFSFKNRKKQIRLSVINLIFMLAFYPFLAFYIWSATTRLHTDWHLRMAVILPLINLILNYLAIGAIGKDEKLVKSLDRLR